MRWTGKQDACNESPSSYTGGAITLLKNENSYQLSTVRKIVLKQTTLHPCLLQNRTAGNTLGFEEVGFLTGQNEALQEICLNPEPESKSSGPVRKLLGSG